MKKELLTLLFVAVATIMNAAADTWPVTLTTADGLPATKVTMATRYTSRLFTFDEATDKLRITVCETNTSAAATTNYNGRASRGPGFPYFSMAELRVFDADGASIPYTTTSNATALNNDLGALCDDDSTTVFQTTSGKGAFDGNYHYIELTFEKPMKSFSVEWDSRFYMSSEQPQYVGLTPGTDYMPLPEQNLSVEKITSQDALSQDNALFILEGHCEEWTYESYNRTHPGGGFFEAPCLATGKPSAFGIFSLIPVQGKKDTYKVVYLNLDRYISAPNSDKTGDVYMTPDEADAAEVKFKLLNDGSFELTMADGKFIVVENAYMRMVTLENSEEGMAKSKIPFSARFTLYKADISGAGFASNLQSIVDDAERRMQQFDKSIVGSDCGVALAAAVAEAKGCISDPALTYSGLVAMIEKMYSAIYDYTSEQAYLIIDSITTICDAMEVGRIETSSAPAYKKGTYSAELNARMQNLVAEISESVDDAADVAALDDALAELQLIVDGFWESRISCINIMPFMVGVSNDGLPGEKESYGGYVWRSPIYYFNEAVDSLRFTVVQTNAGDNYLGYDVPMLSEFCLYDELGKRIAITEDMVTLNSHTSYGGSTVAALFDGKDNTHYRGAFSADRADTYNYADNPQYCYFDIKLPDAVTAFRYVQRGYFDGRGTPVKFIFGECGVKVSPDTVVYADANSAVCGEKVTDLSQITDDGVYAIYGLMGCDPVYGNGREGAFYAADRAMDGGMHSQCAFTIKSAGDGTYYIQSLGNGKYWPVVTETAYADAVSFSSKAAKVKIAPRGNDGLPGSFVIYSENGDASYSIFQDWGDRLGAISAYSLDECGKDGDSEWYIYRVSMENPERYMLSNMVDGALALNLTVSADPGCYSGLEAFYKTVAEAQAVLDVYDNDACRPMIQKLGSAIDAVEDVKPNPVVGGIYVIESAYTPFNLYQGTKMAIFCVENSDEAVGSNYRCKWTTSPMGGEVMDSAFCFELVSATSSAQVEDWVGMSLISAEEAKDAYFIKSVSAGCYIGGVEASSQPLPMTSEAEHPYLISYKGGAAFEIFDPTASYKHLYAGGCMDGRGTIGDLVYNITTSGLSQWNLRLLKSATTSIGGVAADGEVISVTYYTLSGVASSVPVRGVNIVRTLYSNGVVKSDKIVVK